MTSLPCDPTEIENLPPLPCVDAPPPRPLTRTSPLQPGHSLRQTARNCFERAETCFKEGKLAEARGWLQRMLAITPNELEPLLALGNLSFQLGDMATASEAFAKAAKQRPHDAALQILLAGAAVQAGRIDVFKKAAVRALEIDAGNTDALHLLAKLNLEQGSLTDAAKLYGKILELAPENVGALLGLGVCFFKEDQRDLARKTFERVLELEPNHVVARENLRVMQSTRHVPATDSGAGQTIKPSSPRKRSTILVNNYDYNSCSAGIRVMHYLAALLHAADVPVAVTSPCFFDPTIPVRWQALPDDIVVYPDASRGNPNGGQRICRYMLYYAHAYFGGDRIGADECAIVYHNDYLADIQAHCDHAVTEKDIITFQVLDAQWCFPEEKTIENVLYAGKGKGNDLPQINYVPIAAANAPENRGTPYADHYAHMRTLAMLRKARNFYTLDTKTLMSGEAALCGCKVFYVKDATTFEEQTDMLELAREQIMNPQRDIALARHFAELVHGFFAGQTRQSSKQIPSFLKTSG